MTDMTKKSLAEQYARKCVHFNGVMNKACEAGVVYPDGPIPCLARLTAAPECALRHFPTPEEVAAHVLKEVATLLDRGDTDQAWIAIGYIPSAMRRRTWYARVKAAIGKGNRDE